MLRAVLVVGAVSCLGCGPYCGLGGSAGGYFLTIHSSVGMLPLDLAIHFREQSSFPDGSTDDVFMGAELPSDGTWQRRGFHFSCSLVGVDGGVVALTLSTARAVSCRALDYGGDAAIAITGTGVKTVTSSLHNDSQCHDQAVSLDYVLLPEGDASM